MKDLYNGYGFEGVHAQGNQRYATGQHLDHSRDINDWAYDNRFSRNGEVDLNHSGKGPKGYIRSDEHIKEDACGALLDSMWVDATDIEVEVHEGIVRLNGKAQDRAQKKAAEACVGNLRGVKDVLNNLTLKENSGLIGATNITNKMI